MILPSASKYTGHSYIADRNVKWSSSSVGSFLIELNMQLPHNLALALFGTYPKEIKAYFLRKTYSWMFIETLFVIAKNWNQPKWFSTGRVKLWYVCTMEYCSVTKATNYWETQQFGWISKELCWVNKANPKRLYII